MTNTAAIAAMVSFFIDFLPAQIVDPARVVILNHVEIT
jgi:hypothetical protein